MSDADQSGVGAWRARASAAGLGALTDEELAALARAVTALQRHVDRLPGDLPSAAEPAFVFRPCGPEE